MKSKLKRENYINIQSWMVTDLKLKGNELLIYAIIFGFSQDEESKFTGSCSYLCEWTNSSKQSVFKCLKSLCEKGFLQRFDNIINGVTLVDYRTTKFTGVVNKVDGGSKQSLSGGSKQSLLHNIEEYNIEENKEDIIFEEKNSKKEIDKLSDEYEILLKAFNHYFKKNYKSYEAIKKNYSHWRKIYTPDEIEKAIYNASKDNYWKDILTPEILLRQKNPNGENVDRIGQFLNQKTENEKKSEVYKEYMEGVLNGKY